ncbi:hypothetical protein BLA18110_04330 [Burkholderia lata]|nr:hypothetical protein BLA18110_04330 [Burkholderia lata]
MLSAGSAGVWMTQAMCLRGEGRREGRGEAAAGSAHAPAGQRARGEAGNVEWAARSARL